MFGKDTILYTNHGIFKICELINQKILINDKSYFVKKIGNFDLDKIFLNNGTNLELSSEIVKDENLLKAKYNYHSSLENIINNIKIKYDTINISIKDNIFKVESFDVGLEFFHLLNYYGYNCTLCKGLSDNKYTIKIINENLLIINSVKEKNCECYILESDNESVVPINSILCKI